jgi:hypothetical protein
MSGMSITVACPECTHRKRPLAACPECHAPARPAYDMTAWRLALHAHHLARITAAPVSPPVRLERPARTPLRFVVRLDGASGAAPEPLIEFDATVPADPPLSFDWSEQPASERSLLRLRRSA